MDGSTHAHSHWDVDCRAKAPTQSIARTAAVGGQRRASIKLTDKKSLPCIT
eukprot:m.32321 g.32321  ORF g.32321 m.32321 type:complete len:51 (-) comp4881_c0_seq2:212-364(-)